MKKKNKEYLGGRYSIGNSYIAITNPLHVVKEIINRVKTRQGGYICVSNVRTTRQADKDINYAMVMRNSIMNIPDGIPLIWLARLWGLKLVECTPGPYLFKTMLDYNSTSLRHFLIGDTDETLCKIQKVMLDNGNNSLAGKVSPDFRNVEDYDYEKYAKLIIKSGADIIWVAMSAPKQDFFASYLTKYLPNNVIIGVGAAFRFYIGEYKEPQKKIFQKFGLTGFFIRKIKIKQLYLYFLYFGWILKKSCAIVLKRMLGIPYYD